MKLSLDRKELDNNAGSGGLEIVIEGCTGDQQENKPGTAVFVEFYEGKVQVHIWDGTEQDPKTIELH